MLDQETILTIFIYTLARDEVAFGKIEGIVKYIEASIEMEDEVNFSEKHLEKWARSVVRRLRTEKATSSEMVAGWALPENPPTCDTGSDDLCGKKVSPGEEKCVRRDAHVGACTAYTEGYQEGCCSECTKPVRINNSGKAFPHYFIHGTCPGSGREPSFTYNPCLGKAMKPLAVIERGEATLMWVCECGETSGYPEIDHPFVDRASENDFRILGFEIENA